LATTQKIGPHQLLFDGDWVELRFFGSVSGEHSTAIHARLAQVLAENDGRAHVLADISRLETLELAARRDMAAWNSEHKITAAAVFGGSFTVRTLVTLALKALKLRDRDQLEAVFVKEEDEARRWLAAVRARREAK